MERLQLQARRILGYAVMCSITTFWASPATAQGAVAAMTMTHTEVEADRGGGDPGIVETVMEMTSTKGQCPESPSS